VGKRGSFDLHTVPGVVRAGVTVGAVWGLGMMVLALVTARCAERETVGTAEPMPVAGVAPLLFPLGGHAPETIGEGFLARRGQRRHEAIDVLAPRGKPVLAAADGTVRLTNHAGAGLTVEQDEASGIYCFVYAHLGGYAPGLRDGIVVRRGQVIGYVGTTGNAPPNVPHLHFAVHLRSGGGCWSGAAIDPMALFAR